MAEPRKFRATVRDRVLIHLLDYTKQRHSAEAPPEATQAGIAEVVSGTRSHISMVLASMTDSGLVEERLGHISGDVRRKKTYFLTSKGLKKAKETRERFLRTSVLVFIDGKMEEVEVGELDEILGQTYFLVDILVSVDERGILDMESLTGRKVDTMTVYAAPLVQVQCPRCSFNFLVQTESGAKDVYTVCPNCSNTVPLAGQIVTPPPSQRLRPASAGPVFMAAGVLIVMAALQILVLPLFCGILLLGSSFVIALLAAGTPALREDSYRSRMAILAFGTCLGVYLAVTLKIFLTRTLEVMLYTYAFFVMAPFFALILLPGPIPRRFRDELAVAGGVFLSLTGGAIAFLPGLLPWTQYDAPIWMILGLSAFLYGYESARPVENMSQLIFAGVGAAIIVLVGAAVWQSIESISIQEALVTVMWAALGVLLISIRLIPSMRGHRLEEVLVFTLPLGLGVLFVLFGILVLMQQLYAEGSLELAVGIPLILWGVSQFSRSRWKMWVGILAYVVVLELLSFWTLLWAPR